MESVRGFYVIDVLPLKQKSPKPHHLEDRLKHRTRVSYVMREEASRERRACMLNEQTLRLQERDEHVQSVLQKSRTKLERRRQASNERHLAATEKREALLKEQQSMNRERVQKATDVVQRQRQMSNEKKQEIAQSLQSASMKRTARLEKQKELYKKKVEHAKRVAHENKMKSKRRSSKLSAQLQQKMRTAEHRREILLKTPRSKVLEFETDDWETMGEERNAAAVKLQAWWRKGKMTPVLQALADARLSREHFSQLSFQQVIPILQQRQSVMAVSKLMTRLKRMSGNEEKWKNASRVFLSAFTMSMFPQETMPDMDADDALVKDMADRLLEAYEQMRISPEDSLKLSNLLETWETFYAEFVRWRHRDQEKMIQSMVAHWMELERLWFQVREQADGDANWKPNIESQQRLIQQKLSKMGKHALRKLHEEQAKFREEMGYSGLSESESSASEDAPSESMVTSPQRFPVESTNSSGRDSVLGQEEDTSESSKSTGNPSVQVEKVIGPFNGELTNEKLAHELVMDPDFELKPPQVSPLEEQIRTIAKRAFFDRVREQVAQGDVGPFALEFLQDARSQILKMLNEKGKMAQNVKEYLDLEFIQQKIENKTFVLDPYVHYIADLMSKMCAPIRDEGMRQILAESDIILKIQNILDMLEFMKLDVANFKLRTLRPHLKEEAVAYEKMKFQKALENGLQLTKTKSWLESAAKNLKEIEQERNPEDIDIPENKLRFDRVLYEAVLSLFFSQNVWNDQLPETFDLDAQRIFKYQNQLQLMTALSALIMVARNTVPSIRGNKEIEQRLKQELLVLLESEGTTVHHLGSHLCTVLESVVELRDEKKQLIMSMTEKTMSFKDPIFTLLFRRVRGLIRKLLITGKFKGETLANSGLDLVGLELEQLARKIGILVHHNKRVHAESYDEIIEKLVQ